MFKTVSEWVKAGHMTTGTYSVELPIEKETDRAFGIATRRYNSFGNRKPAICWLPKSKAYKVPNDFYAEGPKEIILLPAWLWRAKQDEGFEL